VITTVQTFYPSYVSHILATTWRKDTNRQRCRYQHTIFTVRRAEISATTRQKLPHDGTTSRHDVSWAHIDQSNRLTTLTR
jgi:hypothetical protein